MTVTSLSPTRFDVIECLVNLSSSVISILKSEGLIDVLLFRAKVVGFGLAFVIAVEIGGDSSLGYRRA